MSQPESSERKKTIHLFNIIMEGRWDEVVQIYKNDPDAQRFRITRSGYTALHMAVSDGKEDIVAKLVHELKGGQRAKKAPAGGQRDGEAPEGGQGAKEALEESPLVMRNDAGNTPLHIAASMGNLRMCKLIARVDPTFIGIKNNDGETPLFLAALHGKNDAFLCLHSFCLPRLWMSYIRRENGDTILHCAIFREYFELAFKIIQLCKDLVNCVNGEGLTPLHVLANKPSAFQSGSKLGRFQKIVYEILSVDKLKVDKTYEDEEPPKNEPNSSCPQDYQTLVNGAHKDLVPPNYATCSEFVKVVYKAMLVFTGGYGGITNILNEKRKHTWSLQVLDELLRSTTMYLSEPAGEAPSIRRTDSDGKEELILDITSEADGSQTKHHPQTTTKKDSVILIAAKHGITEIVKKILKKFPVAIHDTQETKKNIVLVAVENRQLEVYKLLLSKYRKNEGMFGKVDKDGNGALHFAATLGKELHPNWPIPGDALQMQWEIKWLKFVEESTKPKQLFVRYNVEGKTPGEIFTETHTELVKGGGEWMKKTAESCSLVAALIATVAFATSTALPGGVDDQSGKPHLETKSGFQVFAIASLIALCFSVTSLVMFLAILTSRYQEKDFGRNLPLKLLLGLTSLFMSIASMLVSFCAGHFFVLEDTIRYAAFPVYAFTGVPVTLFAAAQFPLYFDLIRATFRSPFGDPTESSQDSEVDDS